MNKRKVDKLIPAAVKELENVGIAQNGSINKTYRGQISTFGAAVINGSLISAIAFFNDNGSSSVDRNKLLNAIKNLIPEAQNSKDLFDYVQKKGKSKELEVKEKIIDAAIALKLAMNLYKLEQEGA